MLMVTILASALAALSIMLLIGGLVLARGDTSIRERLDVYLAGGSAQPITLQELELAQPFSERVFLPIVKRSAQLFGWMWPQNRLSALRTRLAMAGKLGGIS